MCNGGFYFERNNRKFAAVSSPLTRFESSPAAFLSALKPGRATEKEQRPKHTHSAPAQRSVPRPRLGLGPAAPLRSAPASLALLPLSFHPGLVRLTKNGSEDEAPWVILFGEQPPALSTVLPPSSVPFPIVDFAKWLLKSRCSHEQNARRRPVSAQRGIVAYSLSDPRLDMALSASNARVWI